MLPFLEPETLPGSEGLGGVFQHPQLVEEHHVKDNQQHQTGRETGKNKTSEKESGPGISPLLPMRPRDYRLGQPKHDGDGVRKLKGCVAMVGERRAT